MFPDRAALPAVVAMFGLIVGSFLNVCIYRLPRRESIVFPPSRCARCNRRLQWYENIPVLSWLVLRARCRTCGERISLMYPIVEASTALLFVVVFVQYGPTLLGVSRLLLAAALIVLFMIDLQHQILPNAITVPGIVVGFVFSLVVPPGPRDSLIGLLLGGAVPWAIAEAYFRIRGHEGLGMGDVKMLAMIGAFLGWKLMLVTLLVASFSGSLVGLGFIAAGKGARYALPFGTFLAVGALAAILVGDTFLEWYVSFY